MSKTWRDFFTFDYYDLSEDKAAWRQTTLDEDDELELLHEGFRPLGVLRAVHRVDKKRKLTNQVWVSKDGRVMPRGCVAPSFGSRGSGPKKSSWSA